MTVQDVEGALDGIRACRDDAEKAYGLEDALYVAVLKEIAKYGNGWPAALAATALKSRRVRFDRHCA